MLCGRCKTAVSDSDTKCGYCGARVSRWSREKTLWGIAAILGVLFICGAVLYFNQGGEDESAFVDSTTPSVAASSTPKPDNGAVVEPPAPSYGIEGVGADVWQKLDEIRSAAKTYIINYAGGFQSSRGGYLENFFMRELVTAELLAQLNLLEEEYADANARVLYINGADLNAYKELGVSLPSKMDLFCAIEVTDGVALLSENSFGMIYRENFSKLMLSYKQEHGEIILPDSDNEVYKGIADTIAAFDLSATQHVIRYLAHDELYALVMFTSVDAPLDLRCYLFRKEDNMWGFVAEAGVDALAYPHLNAVAPNMNPDIMPACDLDAVALAEHDTFAPILEQFYSNMPEFEGVEPVFISGTNRAIFADFGEGRLFVMAHDGLSWRFISVNNSEDARNVLLALYGLKAPLLIVRQ